MATKVSSVIAAARVKLKETTAKYWTDAELLADFQLGVNDMWGAVIDLNQEHWLTVDEQNVYLDANNDSLRGVPGDCFRVHLIEPRSLSTTGTGQVMFWPRQFKSADFRNARAYSAQDPSCGLNVFYTLTQAGSPVVAPTVLTAPRLSASLPLRFVYAPGPQANALTLDSNNPVPGESDNALRAWVIAYALSKVRDDKSPDPNWLAIYATEKQNLLVRMAPRQDQEPEIVEDLFMGFM